MKIFTDKKREVDISFILVFVAIIGIIGLYFTIFQLGGASAQIAAMELIIHSVLLITAFYGAVYAIRNKETNICSTLSCVGIVSLISVCASVFEIFLAETEFYLSSKYVLAFLKQAVAVMLVFIFIDWMYWGKNMLTRIWYLLGTVFLLIFPAAYLSYCWIMMSITVEYIYVLYFFHSVSLLLALCALGINIITQIKHKGLPKNNYAVWGNFLFSFSIALYAGISILNMAIAETSNYGYYKDFALLIMDVAFVIVVLGAVRIYYNPLPLKRGQKRK